MNTPEMLVIGVGAAAGYWLVNFFLKGRQPPAPPVPRSAVEVVDAVPAAPPDAGAPPAAPAAEVPWHEVLGVSPTAPLDDIRAARDQQLQAYHPDHVATLGPELQALAERKSADIGRAYDAARIERGAAE